MDKKDITNYRDYYYSALLEKTEPFWTRRSPDSEYGGFLAYFDREGQLLSTDKNGWVQGRMTWMYARLYNEVEQRSEWLELAASGCRFLKHHILDENGRGWFSVSREGLPLRRRRYLFVECFAVIAFAEYYKASGDMEALHMAKKILSLIYKLMEEGTEPKFHPDNVETRGHSLTMILISVLQIMRSADPASSYDEMIDRQIDEIFSYFVHIDKKVLLETVGPKGEFIDNPSGRTVNPGHAIETAWFIMEEAKYRNDRALLDKILPVLNWHLDIGWDTEHGGLLSFIDCKGFQSEQIEWDMKFWWPHNEALYASLLAYQMTGDLRYACWFEKIHDWVDSHFPDRESGEWFGYLHYDGTVANTLKGNNWKSFFHLPRQQLLTWKLLEEMLK